MQLCNYAIFFRYEPSFRRSFRMTAVIFRLLAPNPIPRYCFCLKSSLGENKRNKKAKSENFAFILFLASLTPKDIRLTITSPSASRESLQATSLLPKALVLEPERALLPFSLKVC